MQSFVHAIWYGGSRWYWLLIPLALLYRVLAAIRRLCYRRGVFRTVHPGVPVVVVGNIVAGGTGKTPVTLWLVEQLKARGFSPGIVSRGYGGEGRGLRVAPDSSAERVGDEPLLLARRSGCPVIVDADRVAGAQALVALGVDVIIADDGLQHYRLARDFEICVIDAQRGLGNGHRIPAGPLRESAERLQTVDQVLVNGSGSAVLPQDIEALQFNLELQDARRVNGTDTRPLQTFSDVRINAAAAIGNPSRFFSALRNQGLTINASAFRDHGQINLQDFDASTPLLMTEKDAVKQPANAPDYVWYVPVSLVFDHAEEDKVVTNIVACLRSAKNE